MTTRNVALLSPENNLPSDVILRVNAAGWNVLKASNMAVMEELLDRHDCIAGLICLDELADSDLVEIEDFILANRSSMEWIALVSAETLRSSRACRFIKNLCNDYHSKPIELDRLLFALGHIYGKTKLSGHTQDHHRVAGCQGIIGDSPEMRKLYGNLEKIHGINEPLLITGESGTGKELVARTIHQLSARREKPFITVNCGALSSDLLQSRLFSHEQGSCTTERHSRVGLVEAAAGGTLFLDEISYLPSQLQISLLDFIQGTSVVRGEFDRKMAIDTRVIASSNKSLEEAVACGQFREDLYYRINVLQLTVPPLRERDGDIELLAQEYFNRFSSEIKHTAQGFSAQALQAMKRYRWPGNVRELIARVKHAMIMSQNRLVVPDDLGVEVRASPRNSVTLTNARLKTEQTLIQCALGRNRNNVSQSARELGVSRATIYRLMSKFNQV